MVAQAQAEGAAEEKPRRKLRRTRGKPTDVDIVVGQRVRQRRQLLGLSQTKLADSLNVTFQQVQKYERGSNRVGAGRLYQLSQVLDVPVGYFFETLEPGGANADGTAQDLTREQMLLLRSFETIADSSLRRRIYDLVREISGGRE